jgi:hypothetical protein
MNILYVVSRPLNINTSSSIRNRATIDGLVRLGHKIHLITTEADKSHSNYDESLVNNSITTTQIKLDGIQKIIHVGRRFKVLSHARNLAYKVMSDLKIYDNLEGISDYALKGEITDGDYDLIISSSDPKSSHLFVCVLFENNFLRKTPWIQIWGDPFFSDITRKNTFFNSKILKEEKRLLRYACKIIYVSSLTLLEQQKLYTEYACKMSYEPIPYIDKKLYPSVDLRKKELSFLYCGDYTSYVRDIRPLYEAIKNTKHKLTICGNSDIKLESTERISIFPRISFEKLKKLEEACDVLIHLSNLKGTQIPGKIYQYCGTNKPIVFILDGNIELLRSNFNNYARFVFVENDREKIIQIVNNFDAVSKDLKIEPLEELDPARLASEIIH